jgi:hypothetical protein
MVPCGLHTILSFRITYREQPYVFHVYRIIYFIQRSVQYRYTMLLPFASFMVQIVQKDPFLFLRGSNVPG